MRVRAQDRETGKWWRSVQRRPANEGGRSARIRTRPSCSLPCRRRGKRCPWTGWAHAEALARGRTRTCPETPACLAPFRASSVASLATPVPGLSLSFSTTSSARVTAPSPPGSARPGSAAWRRPLAAHAPLCVGAPGLRGQPCAPAQSHRSCTVGSLGEAHAYCNLKIYNPSIFYSNTIKNGN